MKLEELPDDFTPEQFMQLDKEALDNIPFTRKKWLCQCKGCTNGTIIRDYGISPFFFLDRNSKWATTFTEEVWVNLNLFFWSCGKHRKFIARLKKSYPLDDILCKLLDNTKAPLDMIIDLPNRVDKSKGIPIK